MPLAYRVEFRKKFRLLPMLACAMLCAAATFALATDTETVLTSFNLANGRLPQAGLVRDSKGNLYGTTAAGALWPCTSVGGCGTVYRLSPQADGTWRTTTLHRFDGTDGGNSAAALILDSAGNLYGTTATGGNNTCQVQSWTGCGTVFELSPGASDAWTLKTLHKFNGADGGAPFSTLVFDKNGNLYGTTTSKGANNVGTVFQLRKLQNGAWSFATLHQFTGADGLNPQGQLVFDSVGNLFGTTRWGGANNTGSVFKLAPNADGSWTESVIMSFEHSGGVYPLVGVIFDSAGNLFGTASADGSTCGCKFGKVFELTPNPDGSWTRSTIHDFTDYFSNPEGIVFDASGRLIGFTLEGGSTGMGTVFQLTMGVGGSWTASTLYTFTYPSAVGPVGSPVLDLTGNIYGATVGGGANLDGAVFEVSPN